MDPSLLPSSPESQGHILMNTAIAFAVIECFFVAMRYVSRNLIRAETGVDDYLIPLALISNLGLCGVSMAMVVGGGVGRHAGWVLKNDPGAVSLFMKLQIPHITIYAMAVTFPKLAILGLYLRIFTKRWHRVCCQLLIVLVAATGIAVAIVTCFQCRPLAYLWNPAGHPGAHCIDINAFWRWGSFPNIVTDVMILLLPVPCIWKLQLSTRDKVGLIVTFATGSVGMVTSIVRFSLFFQTNGQSDGTWKAVKLGCTSLAEPGVYLMAACLPTYRSLFRSVCRRMEFTSSHGSRYASRDMDGCMSRNAHHSITPVTTPGKNGKRMFGSMDDSLEGFEDLDHDERMLFGPVGMTTRATPSQGQGTASSSTSANDNGNGTTGTGIFVERDFSVISSRP